MKNQLISFLDDENSSIQGKQMNRLNKFRSELHEFPFNLFIKLMMGYDKIEIAATMDVLSSTINDYKTIVRLVKYGVDTHRITSAGTLLHYCVSSSSTDIKVFKYLLDKVDINGVNMYSETILHKICQESVNSNLDGIKKLTKMAKLVVEAGVDVSKKDDLSRLAVDIIHDSILDWEYSTKTDYNTKLVKYYREIKKIIGG